MIMKIDESKKYVSIGDPEDVEVIVLRQTSNRNDVEVIHLKNGSLVKLHVVESAELMLDAEALCASIMDARGVETVYWLDHRGRLYVEVYEW